MARRPRPLRREGNQVATTASLPPPVGGLNDRDALAQMPNGDAVILENWWVEPSRVVTRKGCIDWATGFPAPPRTIFEFAAGDGTYRLYAASDGKIFDITASGAIDPDVFEVDGQSNDEYSVVSVSTPADPPGGSYLYLFNGIDNPLFYDGTTWVSVDGSSNPAITGVSTDSLVFGCVYKNRLFAVVRNSMKAVYLPVGQIGGAVSDVDISAIFQRGGYIVGLYTWTLDAGAGSDDHLVVITSNGEAAVFTGTDPDDATAWQLIGVYYLGRPVGKRSCIRFGGDLLVLCEQGLVPLSEALLSSAIDRRATITDKIQNSINRAISSHRQNFGFELCLHPSQNALILNVPAGIGGSYQYVQNTITKAWTKFTGWNAQTIVNTGLGLYFSDATSVKQAWVGDNDSGGLIVADALPAFQHFGSPSQNKYFTLIRLYLRTSGNPSILYGLNGDFNPQDVTGAMSFTAPVGMIWGEMTWGDMIWGGSEQALQHWQTIGRIFRYAAPRIKVQNNYVSVEWSASDLVFERGGLL